MQLLSHWLGTVSCKRKSASNYFAHSSKVQRADLRDFVLVLGKSKTNFFCCFDRLRYHCKTKKKFCFAFAQNQNKTQNHAGQTESVLSSNEGKTSGLKKGVVRNM